MKYFTISNSTNEKEIGKKWPQCKGFATQLGQTYKDFEKGNSRTKLSNDDYPDFEPELVFELEEKAILTDVISPSNISAKGFLVSDRVKDLMSKLNLMEHRFYQSILLYKGVELKYNWLHFNEQEDKYLKLIDFKKSKFAVTNLVLQKKSDIDLISLDDYWNKKLNLPLKHIRAEKLRLMAETQLDLFYIPYVHSDFFASEKLVSAVKALEITGFSIKHQELLS